MNNFGNPMTDADINMSANPAKAMLQEKLATTGVVNNVDPVTAFAVGGSILSGIFGAKKSASAAKQQAEIQNQYVEAQYEYDLKNWKKGKKQLKDKNAYTINQIATQAKNEFQLATWKDKTNQKQYDYQVQIAESEDALKNQMYQKSEKNYKQQLKINELEEYEAIQTQYQQLYEIDTENRYQSQDLMNETLLAEGRVRSLGQTGNTAAKRASAEALQAGTKMTLLSLSMDNATKESQRAIRSIRLARSVADINAEAQKMLKPGATPLPPEPIATPMAEFLFPPMVQPYDFGTKPIKGAKSSPGAAASAAWGAAIPGIASSALTAYNMFK